MGLAHWLVVGCMCALLTVAQSGVVPTTEESLVIRTDDDQTDIPLGASSTPEPVSEATTDAPSPSIKLTSMEVRSEVSLRYAHTAVVTRVKNPAKVAQEATFRVLLPETAFISGFIMTLDGKSYKAYVKEKEEAKQIYAEAVSQGIGAAHIAAKARDSNHFTVSVNVEGGTSAVFNLTYEELLVRRNDVYNLAVNLHPGALVPKLTVTVHVREAQRITALRVPEMRTGNEIDATEDDPQNSKAVIERGHDDREATITFSPDLDEQRKLMDIYAEKSKESQDNTDSYHYWNRREQEETKPEGVLGQFVVQYDVDRPKDGEILVNDGYFVHFFAPKSLPPLNKHVVFVLDTSGSMMGRKIVQLRDAMQTILSELNPGDYFSIVEFASSVKVYDLKEADEPKKPHSYSYFSYEEKPTTLVPPAPATPDNVAKAKLIVSRLEANGGTNIASALNVAVELIHKGIVWKLSNESTTAAPSATTPSNDAPRAESQAETKDDAKDEPKAKADNETPKNTELDKTEGKAEVKDADKKLEPIIIFLTDGDPTVGDTDPTRIINRLTEKNFGENKASIFSLAFGEDADRKFLRKISLRNEGFMRHIYEASDAALQLRDFYRQVSSPLLADVRFQYPSEQIKEGSVTKSKFRTVYAGSEVVVAGRVADHARELQTHVIGVCGVDDGFTRKRYEISPKVPVESKRDSYLPLERLWAYLTVKQLLDERDAADKPTNTSDDDAPEKRALQIALKYEFVTPLTSLVVVKPNATNAAVDAESVDKQIGGIGFGGAVPLAAQYGSSMITSGAGGPAGLGSGGSVYQFQPPASPQLGFQGAIGPSPISGSNLASPLASYDYVESEDADGAQYPDGNALSYAVPHRLYFSRNSGIGPAVQGDLLRLSAPNNSRVLSESLSTTWSPSITEPPRTTSRLKLLHLALFPWTERLLSPTRDSLLLPAILNNGTSAELELTRDLVPPKDPSGDAQCGTQEGGAGAGVCVYLTRCEDAKHMSVTEYIAAQCVVDTKYAGVCCPRDKVDLSSTPTA